MRIQLVEQLRAVEGSDISKIIIHNDKIKSEALDDLIFLVINETLNDIFKKAGTAIIYDYMERKFQLKREDIPRKPKILDHRKLLRTIQAEPITQGCELAMRG